MIKTIQQNLFQDIKKILIGISIFLTVFCGGINNVLAQSGVSVGLQVVQPAEEKLTNKDDEDNDDDGGNHKKNDKKEQVGILNQLQNIIPLGKESEEIRDRFKEENNENLQAFPAIVQKIIDSSLWYEQRDLWRKISAIALLIGFMPLFFQLRRISTFIFYGGVFNMFFPAIKRHPYGMVYDSETKKPLFGVRIVLYNKNGKIVANNASNKSGLYSFRVTKGKYFLAIKQSDYKIAIGKKYKAIKNNYNYSGEMITVKKAGFIHPNIPLVQNSSVFTLESKKTISQNIKLNRFTAVVFYCGLVGSVFIEIINPNFVNTEIILLYIVTGVLRGSVLFVK